MQFGGNWPVLTVRRRAAWKFDITIMAVEKADIAAFDAEILVVAAECPAAESPFRTA